MSVVITNVSTHDDLTGPKLSELDGKATSTKINVMQVWQKQGNAWKLLARQAVRPAQPA